MTFRRKLVFSVFATGIIWVFLELVLHLPVPGIRHLFAQERLTPILIRDTDLFWRLIPGLDTDYNGICVRVSDDGFRGSYPAEKRARPQRVLCLGDSVTFGWKVEEEASYPDQLQSRLDAFSPGTFSVFNAGIPGHTSFQGILRLPDLLETIKPSVTVLSFSINDQFPANRSDAHRYHHLRRVRRILGLSRLYRLVQMKLSGHQTGRFDPMRLNASAAPSGNRRVMPDAFRRNLTDMIRMCKAVNCRVILMNEYVNNLPDPYDAYHAAFQAAARAEQVPLVDVIALLMPGDIDRPGYAEHDATAAENAAGSITAGVQENDAGDTDVNAMLDGSPDSDLQTTTPDEPAAVATPETPVGTRTAGTPETVTGSAEPLGITKPRRRQAINLLAFETYDSDAGNMVDAYHPNGRGYALIADALVNEISQLSD